MLIEWDTRREAGFTLIELLTVLVIIAILSAIAIPVYLRQRERAWVAQSQAALRDGATAVESYGAASDGNYSGMDGQCSPSDANPCGLGDDTLLRGEGYKKASNVKIQVRADTDSYCITAIHDRIDPGPPAHDWWVGTWDSNAPGPSDEDSCPGF